MNLNHFKEIFRYEINKRLVHPQEQQFKRVYHSSLITGDFTTRTDIDMDILAMVLDLGHDDSEGFDSAEFVLFNHSQRISVVTRD